MFTTLLAAVVATSTLPNPANNYYSWFSPEIAANVCTYIENNEYHPHVDYNGDGILSMCDAVCIARRYQDNVTNGNTFTVDENTVNDIIEQNFLTPCIYWEFDMINGDICREYSITTDCTITADIYFEFEDLTDAHITIEVNPFQEITKVIS